MPFASAARLTVGLALFCLLSAAAALVLGQVLSNEGMIAFLSNGRAIVVDVATGTVARLALPDAVPPTSIAWTRDGERLAFFTKTDGGIDLFVADRFGRHVKRLWHDASRSAGAVNWSPDARFLLVNSGTGIHIAETATGALRLVPEAYQSAQSPVWSPDGEEIAFSMTTPIASSRFVHDIYTIQRDGGGLRRVTRSGSENMSPRWSPDGSHIAYLASGQQGASIDLIDLTSGEDISLTDNSVVEPPVWSPDGRLIAYSSQCEGCPAQNIYVMASEGYFQRQLVPNEVIAYRSPAWSPDGKRLAYVGSAAFSDNRIYVADAESGAPHAVTGGWPPITYIAWLPG